MRRLGIAQPRGCLRPARAQRQTAILSVRHVYEVISALNFRSACKLYIMIGSRQFAYCNHTAKDFAVSHE